MEESPSPGGGGNKFHVPRAPPKKAPQLAVVAIEPCQYENNCDGDSDRDTRSNDRISVMNCQRGPYSAVSIRYNDIENIVARKPSPMYVNELVRVIAPFSWSQSVLRLLCVKSQQIDPERLIEEEG